ncbi:MAG TPA: nitrous oxide reductase accessory protein NosL [Thermoanaerobaculia bacterium]
MVAFALFLLIAACGAGGLEPAEPDASAQCAGCRMTVSDLRFATQLVAKGEEPRFFDDIGCMRKYFAKHRAEAAWAGFVSDYRTKQWVAVAKADYWKCPSVETPMSSHIVTVSAGTEKPAPDCTAMPVAEVWKDGAPEGEKGSR